MAAEPKATRRYHVWTIGCQMNSADSQRVSSDLERLGYTWSSDVEQADVVVLNTCVVRQHAEEKIYGRLGALRAWKVRHPDGVLALMGCMVGHRPEPRLAGRFPHVDVFVAPSESRQLISYLLSHDLALEGRDVEPADTAPPAADGGPVGHLNLPSAEKGRLVSAHVPIVLGCSRGCSYCVIPRRRGPERSRPLDEVIGHVVGLAEQGVREVTLLGQIVDRYGHDRSEPNALADLLARLDAVTGLERVRFLTSHPAHVTDAILNAVAELPKVMEHLEVPVQAGDDEILSRMRRGYTAGEYRRLVERARSRIPGVAVHTDVIVGFPGETERQFESTYALLADLRLDKAHIAKFSPRPGTSAARLSDDVPAEEKELRRRALDGLQERVCSEINGALVGRNVEVLVEGRDRNRWRSRTRTGKLVFFADDRAAPGTVMEVRVVWSGPWSMVAEVPNGRRDAIALSTN